MEKKEIKQVTMTPEWAAQLLADNPNNRSLSRNAVAAMVRDMQSGNFRLNGDAIRVTKTGELADGQHRLTACVKANVPFETYLVTGLDEDDRLTIDRGRPRGVGDNLTIAYGVKAGRLVAATLRNMVIYAKQDLAANPTAAELKELLDLHPQVIDSAVQMVNVQPARPSVLAAIHYVGSVVQKAPEQADAFVKVFKTGIPALGEGDPAHTLRELLLKEKQKGIRGTDFRHYSLFANAWEKFVAGTLVKSARAKDDFRLHGWDQVALMTPRGPEPNGDGKAKDEPQQKRQHKKAA